MPYRKPAVAPDWMRVTEAAARLDCDPRTLLAMINRGEFKMRVMPFGNSARINREDFDREIAKRASLGVAA